MCFTLILGCLTQQPSLNSFIKLVCFYQDCCCLASALGTKSAEILSDGPQSLYSSSVILVILQSTMFLTHQLYYGRDVCIISPFYFSFSFCLHLHFMEAKPLAWTRLGTRGDGSDLRQMRALCLHAFSHLV